MQTRTIYDFGMNNGDDIVYYLKKATKVIGVEANPELVSQCRDRFAKEIVEGKLIIENVAVSASSSKDMIDFFIHNDSHLLSTLAPPENLEKFTRVRVEQKSVVDLFEEHGEPYYTKIDLENFDVEVLKMILSSRFRPRYISAESHEIDVFAALYLLGYKYFNLVDCNTVPEMYRDTKINTQDGVEHYSFPSHSSGPYGEDLKTAWIEKSVFMQFLLDRGLGWKDIHATNSLPLGVNPICSLDQIMLSPRQNLDRIKAVRKPILDFIPSIWRKMIDGKKTKEVK